MVLVNATAEEEAGIGEELGVMGCRQPGLRVVGFEMPRKDRCGLCNAWNFPGCTHHGSCRRNVDKSCTGKGG